MIKLNRAHKFVMGFIFLMSLKSFANPAEELNGLLGDLEHIRDSYTFRGSNIYREEGHQLYLRINKTLGMYREGFLSMPKGLPKTAKATAFIAGSEPLQNLVHDIRNYMFKRKFNQDWVHSNWRTSETEVLERMIDDLPVRYNRTFRLYSELLPRLVTSIPEKLVDASDKIESRVASFKKHIPRRLFQKSILASGVAFSLSKGPEFLDQKAKELSKKYVVPIYRDYVPGYAEAVDRAEASDQNVTQ